MKSIKKDTIQSLKVIILALVIGLGVSMVYAFGPTANPPDNNVAAPINVGSDAQTKAGSLTVQDFVRVQGKLLTGNPNEAGLQSGDIAVEKATSLQGGLSVEGLSWFTTGDVEFGNKDTSPKFKIWKFRSEATGDPESEYPKELCVDKNGYVVLCPDGKSPKGIVDLTLSESQFTVVEGTTINRPVTLSWTIPAGATCSTTNQTKAPTANASGWPVAYTINANGSAPVTIDKFGAVTFTLACNFEGDTITDSVTYTANGYKTYVATGSFTPASAEFNSSTPFTVRAVGGGGGGITRIWIGTKCPQPPGPAGNGGNTTVTYSGSTVVSAQGGKGQTSAANGIKGYGFTTGGATINDPANSTTTGKTPNSAYQLVLNGTTYGVGSYGYEEVDEVELGCNAPAAGPMTTGGGAGATATNTHTFITGGSYNFTVGNSPANGDGTNGVSGAVRFSW